MADNSNKSSSIFGLDNVKNTLTRLFTNDVIVKVTDDDNIRVADISSSQHVSHDLRNTDNNGPMGMGMYGRAGTSALRHSGYNNAAQFFHNNRIMLYQTYDEMEEDPIISSALDIYGNETASLNAKGEMIEVRCDNEEIKSVIENLLFDVLDVEDNTRWWARDIAKYGDLFLFMDIHEKYGVTTTTPLSVYKVNINENGGRTTYEYGEDVMSQSPYASYQSKNDNTETLEEWEVAHMSYKNDSNRFPYGRSIIENARTVWHELSLLEQAMLIHRIMRAPEKREFRIDVGNLPNDEIESLMNEVKSKIQHTPLIDEDTGQYNLDFNMMNMMEDYFIPVRGKKTGTEINTLQGLQYQAVEDVDYLRKKMMSALKIPNAFLGYDQEIQGKCLHPDTEVELLSGESMRVEDIAKVYEDENHETLWTYSYDFEEDEVVPGKIVEAQKTRENAEIVEVELDNGTSVKTTPDHSFILNDGTEVNAEDLTKGDSLKSFYKHYIDNDFENTLSGEDHPRYRKRPQFNKIVSFIESYEGDKQDIRTIFKLAKKMDISKSIIQETIEDNGYTCTTFMNEYWGFKRGRAKDMHPDHFHRLSVSSENLKDFMNKCGITRYSACKKIVQRHADDYKKWKENTLGSCYNHKVVSVKLLNEKVDTYNIEVEDQNENHNYALKNQVFIKNSTLAQESIKFANAVRNLQNTIIQQLEKVALVHLIVRGYTGPDLLDFKIKYTNPSVVAEKERLSFMREKANVARDLQNMSFIPDKVIAKDIFGMSDEEIQENFKEKARDWKREWRKDQITRDGKDDAYGEYKDTNVDRMAGVSDMTGDFESSNDDSEIDDIMKDMTPSLSDTEHSFNGDSPLALENIPRKKQILTEMEEQMKDTQQLIEHI